MRSWSWGYAFDYLRKAEKKLLHVDDCIQVPESISLLGADRLRSWERRRLIFLLLSNLQRFGEDCCTGKPRQHTGKYTHSNITSLLAEVSHDEAKLE